MPRRKILPTNIPKPAPSSPRKSVSFAEGSTSTPTNGTSTQAVDEVTDLFKGLAKKKKPKKSEKKPTKSAEAGDFDAKLAEAGVNENSNGDANASRTPAGAAAEEDEDEQPVPPEAEGDPDKGTGIWSHSASKDIGYSQLLSRFYGLMHSNHPDMMSGGSKSYKIPPPQCLREGNKKTIFANIADICKRMKRSDEHVTSYLFAELGTSGSVDGSKRLVIKGRFQQKQLVRQHLPLPKKKPPH